VTALATYSEKRFSGLAAAEIKRFKAGSLYYLYRGRNAWHSTWVTHYFDGSVSASMWDVRELAEKWRAQGSAFTIREQPALICETDAGLLAITQINTERPLGNLTKRRGAPAAIAELHERLSSDRPRTSVEQFASLLRAAAKYSWSPLCSPKALVLVGTDVADLPIDRLRTRNLKSWRSSSAGSGYYLNWNEGSSPIKPNAILRIVEATNRPIERGAPREVDG
jgi:hypothetical protein